MKSAIPWSELGRRGFEYHRDLLGVELDLRIAMAAVAPSRVEGMADVAMLTAWRGLRRRVNAPWPVAALRAQGSGELPDRDPASFTFGVRHGSELSPGIASPLMPEFCQPATLRIRFERGPDGRGRYMLDPALDGADTASDLTMGWVYVAAAPLDGDDASGEGAFGAGINAPTRQLVYDLLVHESMDHVRTVSAAAFAHVPCLPEGEEGGADAVRLPVHDYVEPMGSATSAEIAEEPRYTRIVSRVLERLGLRAEEFSCFRYRLEYPPYGGQFLLTHPLRPPGGRSLGRE